MDPFEYVMVIVAIIIGLGITRILTGIAGLIQHRATVKAYWVHLVWVTAIFLFMVELWWGWWGLRGTSEWRYLDYFPLFFTPIVLYILSALAFPDFPDKDRLDIRDYYYANHRWFFSIFALYPITLFVSESLLGPQSVLSWQNYVRLGILAVLVLCAIIRNAVFHVIVALLLLAFFVFLIAPRLDVIAA
ncbi:MAG: hypothetical protein AAFZ58_02625 [Pseudomonadota bacterium]